MAEELITDSPEEQDATRIEQRIRNLAADKAKLTADKEEADKAKAQAEAEKHAALKDAEFYKNFNTTASKYPGASDFQDKIREKVSLGLDLEEATLLVMAKEGKYSPPAQPQAPRQSPAGGSAPTTMISPEKPLADQTQAERRAALMEAERRGDIGLN